MEAKTLIEQTHKTLIRSPDILISFIDKRYPQFKGLCYYSKEDKCLKSKEPDKVEFYFDPYHGVLSIRFYQ